MQPDAMDNPAFDRYVEILSDPHYIGRTKQEIAEEVGVDPATLWRWGKRIDWDGIVKERRRRYSQITSSVDDALIAKAQKGDTKAIELYFQRFDGWIPTTGQLKIDGQDSDLLARAAQIREQLSKPAVVEPGNGPDQPGAGEATA